MDRNDVRISDTGTTGLDGAAEIVGLPIIDTAGNGLHDALAMPKGNIPGAAPRAHGMDHGAVQKAGAPRPGRLPDHPRDRPGFGQIGRNRRF